MEAKSGAAVRRRTGRRRIELALGLLCNQHLLFAHANHADKKTTNVTPEGKS
jgi:cytosine/adenosine deaminase-related metal-dependent hydrolase